MLVITRRHGQTIRIGDDIEIKVLDLSGKKVRVGIIAPREIPVHRQEVYDAIREEQVNLEASKACAGQANLS